MADRPEELQGDAQWRSAGDRIQTLLDATSAGGTVARERAEQLVREVVELYGAGLARIMATVGDRADRARAHSEFANRINGGAAQLRMRREAEIIIRAQIDDFLAVENGDRLLFAFEDLHAEIQMLRFHVFESVVQVLKLRSLRLRRDCGGCHDSSSNA